MPKRPTTSRENMIEGAFRIVRREGFSALTARKLAGELGCSTQPVMYQFPDLKELREKVYERADRFHTEYITEDDDFLEIGLRYVRFAAEEPHLFRFLFQSGRFDGTDIRTLTHESVADAIREAASKDLEMAEEDALECFEALFAMVHGYAGLVANNTLRYDEDVLRNTLERTAEGLMKTNTKEIQP